MRSIAKRLAILLVLACIAQWVPAAEIWYEDNNLGRAGGMPDDFIDKFHRPESFSRASRHIAVYMIRANVLNKLDDKVVGGLLLPYLKKNNIRLAIDAGGATWTQLSPRRAQVFEDNMELLARLKRLGAEVHYISLQSVLSKTPRKQGDKIDYPLDKRIADIVSFAKAARGIHPRVEIGIIDAMPSHGKDYRHAYRLLKDAMSREKIELSYVHLDMPFEIARTQRNGITWPKVRELESFVEDELGVTFGFFATSRAGGQTSSKAFHEGVMSALDCYAGATGTPGHFIIASWFRHPQKTVPETATGEDYPTMRTVLEFGHKLESIKSGGTAWVAQRARQSEWRAQCGIR